MKNRHISVVSPVTTKFGTVMQYDLLNL